MSPVDWRGQTKASNDGPEDLTARMAMFTPEEPRRRLSDLVVNAVTERQLRTALAKIQYHDKLYHDWGLETVHPEGRSVAINRPNYGRYRGTLSADRKTITGSCDWAGCTPGYDWVAYVDRDWRNSPPLK